MARGEIEVGSLVQGIANWEFFDGAILAIAVSDGSKLDIRGSGVMVAPGLALTATHVVRDQYDLLAAESRSLLCIGIRPNGRTDLWAMKTLTYPEGESDIAFLGLEPCWDITNDEYIPCMPLSTRRPEEGEDVTILGFRFPPLSEQEAQGVIDGVPVAARGDLFASAGPVTAVYEERRDNVMAPFPLIEIGCGSLDAMSGGPAIDKWRNVIGVLSTGWDDTDPPSNVAWIIYALMFETNLVWPPARYEPGTLLRDLPDDSITIHGKEKVEIVGHREMLYSSWH